MTKKTETAITIVQPQELTINRARAMEAFRKREVPRQHISTRAGRGPKTFNYVDHAHVTNVLLDAFGPYWSEEVLEAHIMDDLSAWARVRLTISAPVQDADGSYSHTHTQVITEIGTMPADHTGKRNMDKAYIIAGAASRGLCKCVARLGYGIEFYEKDVREQDTPESAWVAILNRYRNVLNFGSKSDAERQLLQNQLVARLQEFGIDNKDAILDRFEEAYELSYDLIQEILGTKKETTPMEIVEVEEETEEVPAKVKATPKHGGMSIDEALQYPMPNSAPKLDVRQGQAMLDAAMLGDEAKTMFTYLAKNNGQFGDASLAAEVILKNWDDLPELLHGDEEEAVLEAEVAAENLLDGAISRDEDAVPEDPFGGMLDF